MAQPPPKRGPETEDYDNLVLDLSKRNSVENDKVDNLVLDLSCHKRIKVEPTGYDNLNDVEIIDEINPKDKTVEIQLDEDVDKEITAVPQLNSSNDQSTPSISSPRVSKTPPKKGPEESDNPELGKRIKIEPPEYDNLDDVEIIDEINPKDKTVEIQLDEDDGNENSVPQPNSSNNQTTRPSNSTTPQSRYNSNNGAAKKPKDPAINIDDIKLTTIDSNNVFLCESLFGDFAALEKSLEKVGEKIAHLNINLDICSRDPIRFLQSLSKNCPNLTSLVIRERKKGQRLAEIYWDQKRWEEKVKFPMLKKMTISSEAKLFHRFPFFSALLRTSKIEKISIQLDCDTEKKDLKFLGEFLTKLDEFSYLPELERIKSFKIKSELIKNRFIQQEDIKKILRLGLTSLEVLKIGTGIWGNVSSEIFASMIKKFAPTLKKFAVQGGFGGYVNEGFETNVKIALPQIPHLISFVFQPVYVFEEILEDEDTPKNQVLDVDAEVQRKIKLFPVSIYFPASNTLEELILGNMIEITTVLHGHGNPEFAFGSFRNLKVFKVGSAWHKIAKYPSKKLEKLEEIQFEDELKDPWEIQQIKNEIKTIKKVWIFLPAPEVLREFFRSFWDYGIEEIYLKTRYFFHTTLNSILSGTRTRDPTIAEDEEEEETIDMLKEYGKLKEFVEFFDIDLPDNDLKKGSEQEERALSDFKGSLRRFTYEHVPRKLRIPKGNEHWTSPDCQFHKEIVGFERQLLSDEAYFQQKYKIRSWPNNKMEKFVYFNIFISTEAAEKEKNCNLWALNYFKSAFEDEEKIRKLRESVLNSNGTQCAIKTVTDN